MTISDVDELRKKLLYRSWHRGTREMDLILGHFAERFLSLTEENDLRQYEIMLQESDPDLYDWIIGATSSPERFASLIVRIQESCCCR